MNTFIIFIASLISYIVLDLLWLGVIAKPIITRLLSPWMTSGFKLLPAILVYILLAVATTWLVLPKTGTIGLALFWGAVTGLIIYGVYDLTNYATIANWPVKFVLLDMSWGVISGAIVATIAHLISKIVR